MRTRSWPDGTPIKIFVLDDGDPVHKAFTKQRLNLFPYKLRRVWDRYLFSGTGQPPITVKDFEEMLNRVSSTRGAIGYINKGNVDERAHIIEIH